MVELKIQYTFFILVTTLNSCEGYSLKLIKCTPIKQNGRSTVELNFMFTVFYVTEMIWSLLKNNVSIRKYNFVVTKNYLEGSVTGQIYSNSLLGKYQKMGNFGLLLN